METVNIIIQEAKGLKGDAGQSAYEADVEAGFEGTKEEWMALRRKTVVEDSIEYNGRARFQTYGSSTTGENQFRVFQVLPGWVDDENHPDGGYYTDDFEEQQTMQIDLSKVGQTGEFNDIKNNPIASMDALKTAYPWYQPNSFGFYTWTPEGGYVNVTSKTMPPNSFLAAKNISDGGENEAFGTTQGFVGYADRYVTTMRLKHKPGVRDAYDCILHFSPTHGIAIEGYTNNWGSIAGNLKIYMATQNWVNEKVSSGEITGYVITDNFGNLISGQSKMAYMKIGQYLHLSFSLKFMSLADDTEVLDITNLPYFLEAQEIIGNCMANAATPAQILVSGNTISCYILSLAELNRPVTITFSHIFKII